MTDRWWSSFGRASRAAIGLGVFGVIALMCVGGALWRASWIVNALLRDWAARTIVQQWGGVYQLDLGEVRLDWAHRRVALDSIKLTTNPAVNGIRPQPLPGLQLALYRCTISGVHFLTLIRNAGLVASSFGCRSGTFAVQVPPRTGTDLPATDSSAARTFRERTPFLVVQQNLRLPSYASRIRIARVVFPELVLDVHLPLTAGNTTRLQLERLEWIMADVAIDPTDSMAASRPLFSRSVELVASNFVAHPTSTTTVRVGSLRTSLTDSTLEIRKIEFAPLGSVPASTGNERYRHSIIRFAVAKAAMQGVDFGALLVGEGVRARLMEVDSFRLDILKDNRLPLNPSRPRHDTPQQWIAGLDETLDLDSLRVRHGEVLYRQYAPGRTEPGVLLFARIEATATNVSHFVGRRTSEDPMVLTARAHVQDAGQLDLHAVVPLDAPRFDMTINGTLGVMPAAVLNSFVAETRGLQIEDGRVAGVAFSGSVRNGVTTGTVTPLFNDLSVSVTQAGSAGILGDRGFLGSSARRIASFASQFRLRSDNPDQPANAARVGTVHRVFTPDQTLVVYLWAGVRDGLLQVLKR